MPLFHNACLLHSQNRLTEAEAAYRRAIALNESVAAEAPHFHRGGPSLDTVYRRLQSLLVAAGRHDEAEKVVRKRNAMLLGKPEKISPAQSSSKKGP